MDLHLVGISYQSQIQTLEIIHIISSIRPGTEQEPVHGARVHSTSGLFTDLKMLSCMRTASWSVEGPQALTMNVSAAVSSVRVGEVELLRYAEEPEAVTMVGLANGFGIGGSHSRFIGRNNWGSSGFLGGDIGSIIVVLTETMDLDFGQVEDTVVTRELNKDKSTTST